MERPELKLVTGDPLPTASPAAAAFGAVALLAAAAATLFGADHARRPFDPAPLAEAALADSLATGDPAPAQRALDRLTLRLRANPLDSASRTIAASLLVETALGSAERDAAARQAQAAIRSTPVDGHVAHGAARVLARCGRADLALGEIARMFDYSPDEAAATLADVEPFVPADRIEDGIKPTPQAWLAWSERLRRADRGTEADARLAALLARWPGDLDALRIAAALAASRGRLDELARLVPPSLMLPATPAAAPLYTYRARTKAAAGDVAGSHADLARAVLLSGGDPWVLALAGEAATDSEPALARDYWTRALYQLAAKPATRRDAIWLRYRLARLDDREGRAGDALREWRTILAERPDDAEAGRRIAELTGEAAR